jgi:hypothetical protein
VARATAPSSIAASAVTLACLLWPARADSAAAIPDFSGIWGRNSVDFEPPPSGPGPVMNKTRTFYMRIGDDTNPILRPQAAAKVRAAGAISMTGVNFPTPSNGCTPWPPVYGWRALLMQMVQAKDQVVIIYVGDQQIRHVRLNREHARNVVPSYSGDSIGHYEGDTLVIDTVGVKPGPLSMIDNYGTPFSSGVHIVERIRRVDAAVAKRDYAKAQTDSGRVDEDMGGATVDERYPNGLQISFRVEDPANFTTPWSGQVTYLRSAGAWEERVCADMRHNFLTGEDFALPHADRPDF